MLDTLSADLKQRIFQDAKNTSKDSSLLGPPVLEFAPYGRVPGSRVRKDGRQGTIDQDPEFIDFLQSLTEPVTRSNLNGEGVEGTGPKPAKITTTPLVEYLKEKKANKGKESAASKPVKSLGKPEAKETKAEKTDSKKVTVAKKEAQRSPDKAKVEKATNDAVRAVNKSVATLKGKSDASESVSPSSKTPASAPITVKRERERGSASVAAKILQRDLGLIPAGDDRRTSRGVNSAPKSGGGTEGDHKTMPQLPATLSSSKLPDSTTLTAPAQSDTSSPSVITAPPTGPRVSNSSVPPSQPVNKPMSAPSGRPSRPSPSPSPGARSAFLKHANFSQGVTEEPLYTAFSTFGAVSRCEIDRKKGFGYVDFDDAEGLRKAMLASPVKVGDKGGQVVVLENKNFRSKSRPSIQQSVHGEGKVPSQSQTPLTKSTNSENVEDISTSSAAVAAPTAPRGSHVPFRGGGQHHSPRSGYNGSLRGGFNRAGRGGRANFRGRSTFGSSRGGDHAGSRSTGGGAVTADIAAPAAADSIPATDANTNGPAA